MSAPDRSKIGKANRSKGHRAERAVVTYLREQGWPDAMTTRRKLGHDGATAPGDIDWHPLVCLEVKDVAKSAWPTWCRQAVAECREGMVPAVVRKTGPLTDPGSWECRVRQWERVRVLGAGAGDCAWLVDVDQDGESWPWAVTTLADLVAAVRAVDQ